MPNQPLSVDPQTYSQLTLLARAWNVTQEEVVRRLLQHFQSPDAPLSTNSAGRTDQHIAVHAIYEGVRVDGLYDTAGSSLEIPHGPGAGTYRTPSGAATAVLQALNPKVKPNRNGWSFWIVSESGALLQSLR
ncbi:hypothetical protein ACWCWD_13520 [Streptomyces sp. NPDC001493]